NEHVLTITTSAAAASLVISTPSFSSVPSMISASTRFLAQPSEIKPTRNGRFSGSFCIKDRTPYAKPRVGAIEVCVTLQRSLLQARGRSSLPFTPNKSILMLKRKRTLHGLCLIGFVALSQQSRGQVIAQPVTPPSAPVQTAPWTPPGLPAPPATGQIGRAHV